MNAEATGADAVHAAVTVPLPVAEAFELFTAGFGSWYPAEYTWSGPVLEAIGIELEHRHFARHGDDGEWYAGAMGSEQGWPHILERYAGAAG